jgi:hypothetical protein
MKIEIDGILALELARSSTATAQVEPGEHKIVARMDWERSLPLEVTLTEEEPTRVEVVTVGPFKAVFAMLIRQKLFEVRQVEKHHPSN